MDMILAEAQKLRIAEEFTGEPDHIGGNGRGEHIPVDRPMGKKLLNPLHVGIESHRKHPVRFVENEDLQGVKVERPLEEVVENPPRRPHNNLCPGPESLQLGAVLHTPIDDGRPHPTVAAEELRLTSDLLGQFSGRNQDQGLTGSFRRVDPFEDRQEECPGLPASRLRLDHQIPSRQHVGDRPGLNRQEFHPSRACAGLP